MKLKHLKIIYFSFGSVCVWKRRAIDCSACAVLCSSRDGDLWSILCCPAPPNSDFHLPSIRRRRLTDCGYSRTWNVWISPPFLPLLHLLLVSTWPMAGHWTSFHSLLIESVIDCQNVVKSRRRLGASWLIISTKMNLNFCKFQWQPVN